MIRDLTDKQLIFNLVASAIIEQGGASALVTTDGVVCQYRGPNGRKCAAGHLLPDADYKPEFEGKSVMADKLDELFNKEDNWPLITPNSGRGFLHELQQAHDRAAEKAMVHGEVSDELFMGTWRRRMESIAISHKLDPKAVQA